MDWMELLNQVSQTINNHPDTPHQPGRDTGNLMGQLTGLFEQHARSGDQNPEPLLQDVKQAIYTNPNLPQQPGNDVGGLVGQIENLFGRRRADDQNPEVEPASRDPYGDAGEQELGGVQPASRDPLGDAGFPGMQPASRDPYGDPADEEEPGPSEEDMGEQGGFMPGEDSYGDEP